MDTDTLVRSKRKKHRGWRIAVIVAGCLLVVAVALLGGSYWWFSSQVHTANKQVEEGTKQALETKPPTTLVTPPVPESEEAQNILILGNDTREPNVEGVGRSDVIMLLHVDRSLNFASVMSVPRDLWVDIPGVGKDKINEAYAHGRAALAVKTIKQVFGINVTKYLEIGFVGFEETIDALGGVYVDVDRNYTTRELGVAIAAGYRRLSGQEALAFARFRKDQNYDFGRMARQQRVLAGIREQAMTWTLPLKLPGVVKTALGSVVTNLSANEILRLAYWLVRLEGQRMTQIVITAPTAMIDGKSVVIADENALKEAVIKFLTPPDYALNPGTVSDVYPEAGATESAQNAGQFASFTVAANTVPDSRMWQAAQEEVSFPLRAPAFLPDGFHFIYRSPEHGTYQIDPDGDSRPAVRMVYQYQATDLYLGVSATTWTDAPLAAKGDEVQIDGVTYTLVGTKNKVHHVWWKADGVLYFISNTLMHTVSRDDLLKMASSAKPVAASSAAVASLR